MIFIKNKLILITIFLIIYTISSEKFMLYNMHEYYVKSKDELVENNSTKSSTTKENIFISWEFKNYKVNVKNNGETILTEIYLLLEGKENEKILLGSYLGETFEIKDANLYVLPQEGQLMCETFFKGRCDDFLVYEEENDIIVKHRRIGGNTIKKKVDKNGFYIEKIIHYDEEISLNIKR